MLYMRRVYPIDTFARHNGFLGITSCQACRHPDVVSYISNTIEAAVPALLDGTATDLTLHIVERDAYTSTTLMEWETFALRMSDLNQELLQQRDKHLPKACRFTKHDLLQELETGLRNLILQVLRLPHAYVGANRGRHTNNNDDPNNNTTDHPTRAVNLDLLSFELTLRVPKEDPTCKPLEEGFASGTWYAHDHEETSGRPRANEDRPKVARIHRPLRNVITELFHMDFLFHRNEPITRTTKDSLSQSDDGVDLMQF